MRKEERLAECIKAYADAPTNENLAEVTKAAREYDNERKGLAETRVIAIQVEGWIKNRLDDYLQASGKKLKYYLTDLILEDIDKHMPQTEEIAEEEVQEENTEETALMIIEDEPREEIAPQEETEEIVIQEEIEEKTLEEVMEEVAIAGETAIIEGTTEETAGADEVATEENTEVKAEEIKPKKNSKKSNKKKSKKIA